MVLRQIACTGLFVFDPKNTAFCTKAIPFPMGKYERDAHRNDIQAELDAHHN
jgi:hypothetical protein